MTATASDTTEDVTARRAGRSALVLVVAGFALLQLAWILTTPPFRGIDEFDHSYRAAAVARGEWVAPPSAATRGTGATLTVPTDIVRAATAECQEFPYTDAADCRGDQEGATTRVASGAGRYNPAFYAVVGTAALPFDGTAALYAMRVATAAVCLALLMAAVAALRTWSTSPWTALALLVVCSPMVVYSTTVVAPNGVEIMAAAVTWLSLLGLVRLPPADVPRRLFVLGAVGACVLVTVRSLGPLWAVAVVACVLASAPDLRTTLRGLAARRAFWWSLVVVGATTVASTAWILAMRSLVIGKVSESYTFPLDEKVAYLGRALVLWTLQAVGAFPLRGDASHPVVYACYIVVVVWLLVRGVRAARGRTRLTILAVVVATFALPLAITWATFDTYGRAWQGRYTIPLSMGWILLAGVALAVSGRRLRRDTAVVMGALLVTAHVVALVYFLLQERGRSPGVTNGAWPQVPVPVLAALALTGIGCMVLGALLPVVRPASRAVRPTPASTGATT